MRQSCRRSVWIERYGTVRERCRRRETEMTVFRKMSFLAVVMTVFLVMTACGSRGGKGGDVTPTPTNEVKATPTSTPTEEPAPELTPTETPELTPTETPEPSPTETPTPEPTPEDTPTPEPTGELTPTPELSGEPTPELTGELTPTPELTGELTPTQELSGELTPTPEPTEELTPTPTPIGETSYRLPGLVCIVKADSVFLEPSSESNKLDDVQIGEFVALDIDTSVFDDDYWYRVQYRSGLYGYLRRESATEEIPSSCIVFGRESLAADDWVTLCDAIRSDYWNEHAGAPEDGYTEQKAASDDKAIAGYRARYTFVDGRSDRQFRELTYAEIVETKLYFNPSMDGPNFVAYGYDADGQMVYLQEFILRDEEGATPYDSCRIAVDQSGDRIKEYEFVYKGDNRVLIFGEEHKPEAVLTYHYSEDVSVRMPYCRLDMFYDENDLLTHIAMTIPGDDTHRYNTFFEYESDSDVLIRMVEISERTSDGEWTVLSGRELVRE